MMVVKSSKVSTALLIAVLFSPAPCFSAVAGALLVKVAVLPFFSFTATQSLTSYRIRRDDIERGYLDLPGYLTIRVRTNLNAGVPLTLRNAGEGGVLIRESGKGDFIGDTVILDPSGVRPTTAIIKIYDFRILLSAGTKDGTYPNTLSLVPAL